ncbi:uncharacterized protein LOC142224998 [Haematobia irritans]|uniref:uncharacterized protein LOC142224998 n=1 Tax=Haematobia irritans TaxID=7368 RepID=UPI003F5051D7
MAGDRQPDVVISTTLEWFHYCQAIKRNMRSHKQLLQYIKSSKPASAEYHKIMALPLLPPNLIGTSFRDIKGKIFLMDSEGVFLPFLNYYERQWIQKIGSKNFSVYNQKTRTTSAVEAYNGVLGRSADRGGDFFKFVAVIRNEEFFKSRQFEQCVEGGGTLCKRKKKTGRVASQTNRRIHIAAKTRKNYD